MIKQTSIFDWLGKQPKDSKRLVKTGLQTLDYQILDYLKTNALSCKNKVSGQLLADKFGLETTAMVRYHIKRIRVDPSIHIVIGSDNRGYWVPTESEYLQAIQFKLNKAISEVETIVNMYPRAAKIIQAVSGSVYKKVDKSAQGQIQIPFNGWESEIINHYADKYVNVDKNKLDSGVELKDDEFV